MTSQRSRLCNRCAIGLIAAAALLPACGRRLARGDERRDSSEIDESTIPDAPVDSPTEGLANDATTDPQVQEESQSEVVDGQPPLADLPQAPSTPMHSGVFIAATECAFCHSAGSDVLTDSYGRDISPTSMFTSSMMAYSGRDPYWLAQLSHERASAPARDREILDVCTRCHTPVANFAARTMGDVPSFEALTAGTSPVDHLGREGVTCTVCHQISDQALGSEASFVGGYVIGTDRQIFGPHANPFTMPMMNRVNYVPTESAHVMQSEMCATCHTVLTEALDSAGNATGAVFPEQVPYLEWLNSSANAEGASCQTCHTPRVDENGEPYEAVLSLRPPSLSTVRPIGVHTFRGGNANMLEILAENREWAGISTPAEVLRQAAADSDRFIAASVHLSVVSNEAGAVVFRVTNDAGHKFPTAYPTRRAWLEVVARDANGVVVFHSGASDDAGFIIGPDGQREGDEPRPHFDVISDAANVQVWQGVMADIDGVPTHTLLRGARWWKDNRLLPRGWRADHAEAPRTAPVGVDGDATFLPGSDDTTYMLPATAVRVEATLVYQSVPPTSARALDRLPTAATRRFLQTLEAAPPTPRRIATVEASVER